MKAIIRTITRTYRTTENVRLSGRSDNAGNRHLVNLSAIASIEDRRIMIVLHFVNTAQKPVSLSMSYGAIKDSIQKQMKAIIRTITRTYRTTENVRLSGRLYETVKGHFQSGLKAASRKNRCPACTSLPHSCIPE